MKKRFVLSTHLSKTWYAYLLWLILAIILWAWLFSVKTAYKEDETVYIFFGTYTCDESGMKDRLYVDKPDKIKNIVVYNVAPNDEYFDVFYQTRCLTEADIIVLPESKCDKNSYKSNFCPLDTEYIESYLGNCEYSERDGVKYGIKVFDKESLFGVATGYIDYTARKDAEDYYLFFNKKSLHLGELRLRITNGAIVIAKNLFNLS